MPAVVLNRKVSGLLTAWLDHAHQTIYCSIPVPVAFWLLRLAIRLLGLVSPALAGRWVYRLWFQPLRFPEPPQEQEWRSNAQPLAMVHRGQRLAVDLQVQDVLFVAQGTGDNLAAPFAVAVV